MSKKHRNKSQSAKPAEPVAAKPRTKLYVLAGLVTLAVVGGLVWLMMSPKAASRTEAELAALQRSHAATIGSPSAPVQIVEFLDPACETCAKFFPLVKAMMRDNPGDIRLSVRLIPFHKNADFPAKALEAAKLQGKFWDVLERLFATQQKWTIAHRVEPDKVWAEVQTMNLDLQKLQADMESPVVLQNLATDMQDAKTLKVTATPEYFVNGRGLPEFGYEQLRALVNDELKKAKR